MIDDLDADRAAIEDLEAELSAVEADIRDRMEDAYQRRETVRDPHPFDASVRDRALQVGRTVRPSVVFLHGDRGSDSGAGTAWFVDDHLLMTNAHAADTISEMEDVWAFTLDDEVGDIEVVESVSSWDPDIALLRTDLSAPSTLSVESAANLNPGDPLVQVGNSSGFWPWAISLGALEERDDGDLVSSIPSRDGASGSPILTLDGDVVGMHYAGSVRSEDYEDLHPVPSDEPIKQFPLQPERRQSHVPGQVIRLKLEEWT